MKKAVFIGRFQPFHNGHLDALSIIFEECDYVYLVIGSANISRTPTNPWTYLERLEMIESALQDFENISIIKLDDIEGDDDEWMNSLQKAIGNFDILYSGNDWVLDIAQSRSIHCKKISPRLSISATMIREKLSKNQDIQSYIPSSIYHYICQHCESI